MNIYKGIGKKGDKKRMRAVKRFERLERRKERQRGVENFWRLRMKR
jgi:hypothetical protein